MRVFAISDEVAGFPLWTPRKTLESGQGAVEDVLESGIFSFCLVIFIVTPTLNTIPDARMVPLVIIERYSNFGNSG